MKKIFCFSLLVIAFHAKYVHAQNEGTLTFMNSIAQVVNNNPAFIPKYKISIGLPVASSVMAYYSNNGFSYNDVYKRENDTVKADLNKLYGAMKPKNYITQALQVDLFRLGLRINSKLYLTLNSSAKVYNRIMIPKDLMNIFVNGNAAYVGQTASISPTAESTTLLETSLGGAYQVDEKLTIGARVKFLKGITNVTTQSATMNLTEDSNYALTANAGMDVRTSGIHNFSDSNFDFGSSFKDYLKNNGLAIDLGATYKIDEKLTLGASLIDIGKIHWQNNTYGYSMNPAKANYTFPGVDLSKVINGNGDYLKSLGDTLQNKFKVQQNQIGSYSTPLPGKMYLSGMYEIRRNLTLGAVFFSEKFRGKFSSGLTLGANKHFGRWMSTALTYTVTSNSFNNLGAGFSLNLSPIQIYFVGDNILRIPFAGMDRYINSTKFFNLRFGLNFVFGWNRKGGTQSLRKQKNTNSLPRKLYGK